VPGNEGVKIKVRVEAISTNMSYGVMVRLSKPTVVVELK
jgi:hypothetical protein